jgi:hypothetical protein
MIPRLPEIWKQTRDLPPNKKELVDRLFVELERVNQKLQNGGNDYTFSFNTGNQPYLPGFNANARIQ